MWIVETALKRPYTFVVLAVLIALFGLRAAITTPTDIFPNIDIPVISVVWTYSGLPPDDMSGRIIYYYERTLISQVSDIEHVESQSLAGYGVVKIFFQKNVNISVAHGPGHRGLADGAQAICRRASRRPTSSATTPRASPSCSSRSRARSCPQMQLFDAGQNFIRPQLATVEGAAVPSPYGGQVLARADRSGSAGDAGTRRLCRTTSSMRCRRRT